MQTWEANVRRVVPYTPGEQPDHQDLIRRRRECAKLSVGLNRSH